MDSLEMKQVAQLKTELRNEALSVGKYKFIGRLVEAIGPDTLRKLGD